MSSLTNIEKMKLEKIFDMRGGYVLDYTDRTFQEFIYTSTKIDIRSERYSYASGSKANRLRAFWDKETDNLVGKLISEMLEYWKTKRLIDGVNISSNDQLIFNECLKIAGRLCGKKEEKRGQDSSAETDFINREFKNISLDKLTLDGAITDILKIRLDEIRKCLNAKASLATLFLCGSTLEGVLLGTAIKYPRQFNQCKCAPSRDSKVLPFPNWKLSNFIDAAYEIGILDIDVKKHSHSLRDFRNYIHPYEQLSSGFDPHEHTAKISWQVLQAAIFEIGNYKN